MARIVVHGPGGDPTRMVTAAEAAERLCCNERTVRRKLARGELSGQMFAGRWLVFESDLPEPSQLTQARQAAKVPAAELRRATNPPTPRKRKTGRYLALAESVNEKRR